MLPKNESEALRILQDPEWRIRNLYWIIDKSGHRIPFNPNADQILLLDNLWNRNIILKARQRGFSTMIQLMMLDQCVFNRDIRAGVIAQDRDSANVIFRDKIKFAWDNMPAIIREELKTTSDSASELLFTNNSSIRVSTSMRSGTLQYLHVSEFGKICAKYPLKAREVLTGSLPTVANDGFVFIESTAEGRAGAFFDMTQAAQKAKQEGRRLSALDYRFHFFSWFTAPEYAIESDEEIGEQDSKYFDEIEVKAGVTLSKAQRNWYVQKRKTDFSGDSQMMKQEYPSLPEEAFEQSVEGCYYTQQMTAARKDGRIGFVPYLPGHPVNTFWDIGHGDGTAIWFHQRVNGQDRFINFYEEWGEPYAHFVSEMQKHGYVWGRHYLPHDANQRRQGKESSQTPEEMLNDLGLSDTVIVPVIDRKINGINQTRNAFATCWFDKTRCEKGIVHMDSYHKEWDWHHGCWRPDPAHDIHSEAADAFRQFGQIYGSIFVSTRTVAAAPTFHSEWG